MKNIAAFLLIILLSTAGLSGVLADEYNCAATETETPYRISDTAGKINGYTLHGGLADDEANYYVSGYKSSSDQVIFKLQASDMTVLTTYDIDETQIPDMFASDGLSISNESGTLVAYGWDSANENDINKYVFGTGATSIKFTNVKGGTGFAGEQMYHGFAINKNGSTTDAPTKYYITVPVDSSSTKVYECDWDNTNTCVQLTNTGTQPIRQQGSGIEYQTNDTNQELILMYQTTPNPSTMYIRSFDAPTFSAAMDSTSYILNSSGFPTLKANGIAQISSIEIKAIYEKYPTDGIWVKTFSICETIDTGVYVSVEEFDNANQAKAVNDGTIYATFDDSVLLGWQALSLADTLNDFDGEYSTDATNWVNIAGLQNIGDADAGYLIADFGEQFETTTYKDAGTTTADWDTTNEWVVLSKTIYDDFLTYDIATWTSPQPAFATIVSEELKITSVNAADNKILSSETFEERTLTFNAKLIDTATDTVISAVGFRNAGAGAWFNVFDNDLQSFTHDGSAYTANTINSLWDTNYHDYKIVWTATDVKFYVDDVLEETHTTNLPTSAQPVSIRTKSDAGTTVNSYIEYIYVDDYNTPEIMQTLTLDNTVEIISKFNFSANETTPANTEIIYDVSCDGGSNWETGITEETSTDCNTNGSDLRVKANLATTDTAVTPTLNDFAINYTTDGTDAETPSFFTTDFFSYDWNTSSLSNGQYFFQMTATDDGANSHDDESQQFTVCHGDTIQAYESPDLTTDIYTSIECTGNVEITRNDETDINLKIVNQDTNTQTINVIVSNTTDNNGHYYVYECTDSTFITCTFNSSTSYGDESAGNGLKTYDGSTFTHKIVDTYTSLETKYIQLVYREPYYSVEMAFDEDANFTTFYGVEETDTTSTGCSTTQPCTHATVTAANNWQTKSLYDLTGDRAIIRFTAWTDAATSKEIEVAFEQLDGIQEFTTMETVTITSTPQTYTVWLTGFNICVDGNECKLNIKTNLASGSYNLFMNDVFIEPDSYFTQLTHLLQSDYLTLPSWLIGGVSEPYLNEGKPFRVSSSFYDTFGDLASYTIEGFVATDENGTSELMGLTKLFTLTPTAETFYEVDWLQSAGIIALDGTYDYVKVVVTVFDGDDVATEMQTQYVQFHNYPFFENDVLLNVSQRIRSLNTSPSGTVTLQITEPQNLNSIKVVTCEGKIQPDEVQDCLDNQKVTTEFLKDIDFNCDGNSCIFDYTQNTWVFETSAFYTTVAIADLKTCEVNSCGPVDYLNGLTIYRIIPSESHAEVSFEVPLSNVVNPANFGNYSTYGNYMGNWNSGALIPTDYRINIHAILYLENGEYDFTKYVNAHMRVLTTGEVVESPDFLPIKTSYDYDQKTGHYWFSSILYDTNGAFFTNLTNHLLEVSFSDESDKSFTGLISVQNALNFDDSETVDLDTETELLKLLSLASLSNTSFYGTNYIKNVNMADEVIFTIHNENSSYDDQKTDRQNQINRFTIPAYILADLPADYNLTLTEFQEKTAEITGLDLQSCVDSVEYPDVAILDPFLRMDADFLLFNCYAEAFVSGSAYWVGSLTKPITDAIQFNGFITSFGWRIDGFKPYDYNLLQSDYPDTATTDINSKIDEVGLTTGQGNITLNVGDKRFTQQNNLVYGSAFSGSRDVNATFLTNQYNITIKLVYDDFSKSKSITSKFAMRDNSFNEESFCFSRTHLERGDYLSCFANSVLTWTLQNLAMAIFILIVFFAVFWAYGQTR